MKTYDTKQVEKFLEGIWESGDHSWDKVNIEIEKNDEDQVKFVVSKMYGYVPLNLTILKQLSEFFRTDNINDSRYAIEGCDTCDYGSSYSIYLTVKPDEAGT